MACSKPMPSPGFVHLILLSDQEDFYLNIPIDVILPLCLHPRKYLKYVGWCVLGIDGTLADGQGIEVALHGQLVDGGVYRYIIPPSENPLAHAVDVEVIKQRSVSPSSSETTTTSNQHFQNQLLERDGCCVWTGLTGAAMHIIPFRRGTEWLRLIVKNRTSVKDFDIKINDLENGILADDSLRNHFFHPRHVVVLKTPNLILEAADIPARAPRSDKDASYPETARYTLQWIVTLKPAALQTFANNSDAMFVNQALPKPAEVLLHYNYGAAVVKHWGKNTHILTDQFDIPKPLIPAPTHRTIRKRVEATNQEGCAADSEAEAMDEDDVVLFCWGNSRVARERTTREEEARNTYLEEWRTGVTM